MSNTLKFEITEKEIDSNNDISDERDYSFSIDFDKYQKGKISLSSGTTYSNINFVNITTATALKINSDQSINVKFNSGSEIFSINKDIIFCGSFTALSINNASGTTATINYELYGTT